MKYVLKFVLFFLIAPSSLYPNCETNVAAVGAVLGIQSGTKLTPEELVLATEAIAFGKQRQLSAKNGIILAIQQGLRRVTQGFIICATRSDEVLKAIGDSSYFLGMDLSKVVYSRVDPRGQETSLNLLQLAIKWDHREIAGDLIKGKAVGPIWQLIDTTKHPEVLDQWTIIKTFIDYGYVPTIQDLLFAIRYQKVENSPKEKNKDPVNYFQRSDTVVRELFEKFPIQMKPALNIALAVAATYGKLESVSELLQLGAQIDSTDFNNGYGNFTPLANATLSSYLPYGRRYEVMKMLINAKADPDLGNPLSIAIQMHDSQAVQILVYAGANVNAPIYPDGRNYTYLHLAYELALRNIKSPTQQPTEDPIYKLLVENGAR